MEEQLREAILACEYANHYHEALAVMPKELRGTVIRNEDQPELTRLYRKMITQVHKALRLRDAMSN